MIRMNHQIIQTIATASLVAIAGAILTSVLAIALNHRFEEAWQENLNVLNERFEEARKETLNS